MRLFCGMWAIALLLTACGGVELDTRTFELRYLDAGDAMQIVAPYVFTDRERAPGTMNAAQSILTVRETPDNLAKIERVLDEFDKPRPSVRLNFQVIRADGSTTRDTAIAEIEDALRKLFRFQGYRLVADAVVAGVEGSEITQSVTDSLGINAEIVRVRGVGDSSTVQIAVELFLLAGGRFRTLVAVPVGQTVVLGNAQPEGGRGQLILTVRPELVGN